MYIFGVKNVVDSTQGFARNRANKIAIPIQNELITVDILTQDPALFSTPFTITVLIKQEMSTHLIKANAEPKLQLKLKGRNLSSS